MDTMIQAQIGHVPFPYILMILLLPVWTLFLSYDKSLLLSLGLVVSTLLKGSFSLYWTWRRFASSILRLVCWLGVVSLEIFIIQECVHSYMIVILVPLSTLAGFCIVALHVNSAADGKDDDPGTRRSRKVIGIFSRSSEQEYNWLSAMLMRFGKVVPFPITNSNAQEFRHQVSQCSVAILYHSKTRGRVNITNVTDSLYDEELKYMSSTLGRDHVFVVCDDLEDSSSKTKNSILNSQTSIRDLTRYLCLFTKEDKMDAQLRRVRAQPMLDLVSTGSEGLIHDIVVTVLVLSPWCYFIYKTYESFLVTSNVSGSCLLYHSTSLSSPRSELPLVDPTRWTRPQSKGKGSRNAGIAVVMAVMVYELVSLLWISSTIDMVVLAIQSVSTGAYVVILALS